MAEGKLDSILYKGAPQAQRKVTFCRICEASCGLVAAVDGQRVLSLSPDPDHVMSRGFACVKGTRYAELHDSPDRLTTPWKRVGARFEPISWAQALREIGEKVSELRARHGADSVGMYVGNPAAFSPAHIVFAGAFAQGLKTRHLYTSGSQDCNNKFVAAEELFGSPLLQPIPDIDRLNCFVVVGSNPAVSQLTFVNAPRLVQRLKARERAGARIVFVNPRRTESAQQVGEQLYIRPGSDVFFFLGFARELFAGGYVQKKSAKFAHGVEQLRSCIWAWSAERVAERTGIAAEVLRGLVASFAQAKGAALYAGTGVNQGPHGTLCVWLLHAIQLLTGNIDSDGGMLMTRTMQRAARLGYASGDAIEHRHARFGGHRSVLDSLPAGIMPDEILTPGDGQLRALFVTAGNPVLSCPNSTRMKRALAELELLVAIDLFRNETGNLAHYVLPATSFLERGDVPLGMGGYQPEPYAQWVDAVVAPRGEAKDEWWIFAQLGAACAAPLRGSRLFQWFMSASSNAESRLPRLLRFTPSWLGFSTALLHGTRFGKLRKHPHGVLLRRPRAGSFLNGGLLTKHGKVELAPARFVQALAQLEAESTSVGGFNLITKRERASHNSWLHNVEALVRGNRATNHLYVHPDDAAALALVDGAWCEVSSATGSLRVPVRLSDELMRGTVALPHGWGHAEADGLTVASRTRGVNANLLSPDGPDALERLSGMARLTAIPVQLRAVAQSSG